MLITFMNSYGRLFQQKCKMKNVLLTYPRRTFLMVEEEFRKFF